MMTKPDKIYTKKEDPPYEVKLVRYTFGEGLS
jgi:hypothetical protein